MGRGAWQGAADGGEVVRPDVYDPCVAQLGCFPLVACLDPPTAL